MLHVIIEIILKPIYNRYLLSCISSRYLIYKVSTI